MSTQVITIKVDPATKKEAQRTADILGLSLSAVIKGFLNQFIRTKTVTFSAREEEIPSQYLIDMVKKAREHRRQGKGSPIFDNAEDAITYLHKQGI